MTVTTNTNKVQALGNGVTKTFPYTFRIYSASDLVVTSTNITTGVDTALVLNTDYTVTGAGSYNGGNVVLTGTAPSATTRITIRRAIAVTQGTDLRNQGAYFAETHEDVFDRLMMIDQQQQETLDRSLAFPASDAAATHYELPAAAARANNLLGFDENGKPVAVAPAAQSATALQALLAASSGSSLVGFIQAGVGAVKRLVQDKLRDSGVSVMDFGAVGDGVADDTAELVAAIEAADAVGGYVFIPGGKNIRITQRLDALTTKNIRIRGPVSAFQAHSETVTSFAKITCDGCALVGDFDSATSAITYSRQLKVLENVFIKASGGAKYGAIVLLYYGDWKGVHFEDFSHHGIWSVGSCLSNFGPISFNRCGEGRTTSGTINSDNFTDGCAVFSVGGALNNGAAGNITGTRQFSSLTYSSSNNWDIAVESSATTSTSFKGFIGSNLRSSSLRIRGYQGVWLGYCNIQLINPHLEVYANGGEVANDGAPYALVTYNSSPVITGETFATTTPTNPNGSIRFLRTTAFTTGTDYWGYDISRANKRIMSRAHIAEFVLGDFKPDAGSYGITPVAGLGSSDNPIGYWDKTLRALRFSAGTRFVASGLSLPLIASGTVTSGGGTVDVDATIIAPNTSIDGNLKGTYELEIQITDQNFGRVYYHGTWKAFRTPEGGNNGLRFYELGSKSNNPPAGGFTVAEAGAGPYTLRITNSTAANYTYIVSSRLVGTTCSTSY